MTSTEFAPISSDNLSVQLEDLKALCAAQRRELFELRQQHETDQALIRQLEGDAATDREAIANLETALGSARQIGAAMGIIMCSRKVDADEAFFLLRRTSQNHHRKLREVAEDVLYTGEVPDPTPKR